MPRRLKKEVAMERAKMKRFDQQENTLRIDNSDLSLIEKSNRFARFFAYAVAFSKCPRNGDVAGRNLTSKPSSTRHRLQPIT